MEYDDPFGDPADDMLDPAGVRETLEEHLCEVSSRYCACGAEIAGQREWVDHVMKEMESRGMEPRAAQPVGS